MCTHYSCGNETNGKHTEKQNAEWTKNACEENCIGKTEWEKQDGKKKRMGKNRMGTNKIGNKSETRRTGAGEKTNGRKNECEENAWGKTAETIHQTSNEQQGSYIICLTHFQDFPNYQYS